MKIGLIGIDTMDDVKHFENIQAAIHKNLYGIFSPKSNEILPISKNYKIELFHSVNDLIEKVDSVYFAKSLKPNLEFAIQALKGSCHLFIEDISMLSIDEIKLLYKLAFEAHTKIQLKVSKSFSPEFLEVRDFIHEPKLIEITRKTSLGFRIDEYFNELLNYHYIASQHINSGIKKISTLALPLMATHYSLVYIRADFDNGAVLQIKFDHLADEDEETINFYQKEQIVQIDLLKQFANKQKFDRGHIVRSEYNIKDKKAFHIEILNFIKSIQNIDIQNISESPAILRIIQNVQSIQEKLRNNSTVADM